MELFKVAAVKPVRAVDLGAHLLSYVFCWLCVLVRMYNCACMYASMYACTHFGMYANVCMFVCSYACMYFCMYVCTRLN